MAFGVVEFVTLRTPTERIAHEEILNALPLNRILQVQPVEVRHIAGIG